MENKEEILALLRQGRNVAFLTLGDAMFYSTYIYLFERLSKEDIDIVTVPGVPAEVAQAVYDALRAWGEEAQTVAEKAR